MPASQLGDFLHAGLARLHATESVHGAATQSQQDTMHTVPSAQMGDYAHILSARSRTDPREPLLEPHEIAENARNIFGNPYKRRARKRGGLEKLESDIEQDMDEAEEEASQLGDDDTLVGNGETRLKRRRSNIGKRYVLSTGAICFPNYSGLEWESVQDEFNRLKLLQANVSVHDVPAPETAPRSSVSVDRMAKDDDTEMDVITDLNINEAQLITHQEPSLESLDDIPSTVIRADQSGVTKRAAEQHLSHTMIDLHSKDANAPAAVEIVPWRQVQKRVHEILYAYPRHYKSQDIDEIYTKLSNDDRLRVMKMRKRARRMPANQDELV